MLCAEEIPENTGGRREKKLRHNKILFVTPEVWILIAHLYVYCVKALSNAVGRTISNIVSKQWHLLMRQVLQGGGLRWMMKEETRPVLQDTAERGRCCTLGPGSIAMPEKEQDVYTCLPCPGRKLSAMFHGH